MVNKLIAGTETVKELPAMVENVPLVYQPLSLCEKQPSTIVKDLASINHQFMLREEQTSTTHKL